MIFLWIYLASILPLLCVTQMVVTYRRARNSRCWKYDEAEDRFTAVFVSLFWPILLIVHSIPKKIAVMVEEKELKRAKEVAKKLLEDSRNEGPYRTIAKPCSECGHTKENPPAPPPPDRSPE